MASEDLRSPGSGSLAETQQFNTRDIPANAPQTIQQNNITTLKRNNWTMYVCDNSEKVALDK